MISQLHGNLRAVSKLIWPVSAGGKADLFNYTRWIIQTAPIVISLVIILWDFGQFRLSLYWRHNVVLMSRLAVRLPDRIVNVDSV